MVRTRKSPEEILARSNEEARLQQRGKLKIYLGAAPGVGKTYTMLHDALEKRADDLDVVVGVVESHGRQDIESLLKTFEILPRQTIEYRNKTWVEFDLDAALKRSPGLILIDEMAHTNAPDLRHAKRWQDIKECLDRGIDVYTTLNVQHIESLKDDVAQIIQTTIRETVPDSMIEMANTIEVVDLPPEELLKRLEDGKVYFPEQAELATDHFFRKGNLIALRELALRITAERVGTDVLVYRQNEGITQIWPTKDKILVCVGSRPDSMKLIRAAKRMATSLQSEWIAIYVDTPSNHDSVSRNKAIANLRLAEQLGAVTHVLSGYDLVQEILSFARDQNVTQIMLRKNISHRWMVFFKKSLADEIVRHSGEIDVYMMTGKDTASESKTAGIVPVKSRTAVVLSLFLIASVTLFNIQLSPYISTGSQMAIYLASLFVIALFGELRLSIVAAILCVLSYDFFFIPPSYTFRVTTLEYILTLLTMFGVAQLIGYLTIMIRRKIQLTQHIQHQTTALYILSRQLTHTRGVPALVSLGANYISDLFKADVMVLLFKKDKLAVHCCYPPKQKINAKERSVGEWVFEMGISAGLGTDTLSFSKALYLPLQVSTGPIGVLRIQPRNQFVFTPEERDLLDSCIHQISLALDVDRLYEKNRKKELKLKTEQARLSVLGSISRDLYSSLKVIGAGFKGLKKLSPEKFGVVGKEIDDEIEKLTKLNNNILRVIQLEEKDFELDTTETSLKELIQLAVKLSANILKGRSIHTSFPKILPTIKINEGLIKTVLLNLIDNAVKFTPPKSPIAIFVQQDQNVIRVSVEDRGPGVLPDETTKLFEKFYRGKQLINIGGLGLGLAICQRIIASHGGKIWVENMENQGAAFRFTLPL